MRDDGVRVGCPGAESDVLDKIAVGEYRQPPVKEAAEGPDVGPAVDAPFDDLADSGHTLKAVIGLLKNNYAPITELRSAVIWTKELSTFTPDYSVEYLPTNPWIHQPFESYDAMRPAQLLEKWKL